jgi:hypothetical protein
MVMDPMFIDENGRNLDLTRMPDEYVEAVLNSLNPAAFYSALGPKQLDEMFGRAGKFANPFKAIFATAVKKWQNRPAPKDLKSLQVVLKLALLHEFTHALALNMPDVIPANLASEEQARLNQFSVSAYIKMLSGATDLHGSVVYVKNLMKALQSVEGQELSPVTQNTVVRLLALEMFCDRFSMFMYETSLKLQAYREAMPDMGEITVDVMRKMEKQRRGNPAAFKCVNELTDQQMAALAIKLKSAETAHIFISVFDDPPILEAEHAIFDPFLDLIRRFDRERSIDLFTEEHSTGEFFRASKNGNFISENKMGVDYVVQNWSGPSRRGETEVALI